MTERKDYQLELQESQHHMDALRGLGIVGLREEGKRVNYDPHRYSPWSDRIARGSQLRQRANGVKDEVLIARMAIAERDDFEVFIDKLLQAQHEASVKAERARVRKAKTKARDREWAKLAPKRKRK